MNYMDMLAPARKPAGSTATLVGSFDNRHDARRIAAQIERRDDDSREFREIRKTMHQTHGFCG